MANQAQQPKRSRYETTEWIDSMTRPLSKVEGATSLATLLRLQLVSLQCPLDAGPAECRSALETTGFTLGAKIVDKLAMDKARLNQQRDLLKFICREVWVFFYGKQADRLQTNKRGGYIIFDAGPPWLRGCPVYEPPGEEVGETDFPTILSQEGASGKTHRFRASADAQASIMAGIIRGSLSVLGCESAVVQDLKQLPGCSFHVTILNA